jgi:hypothetical protein
MKWFHRIVVTVVLLTSISAFANSTNFTQLGFDIGIRPNDGSGGNLGGTIFGTGVNLAVGGGTPYDWLNSFSGYAPGSGGGGGTTIFFDTVFGQLGGQTYGDSDLGLNAVSFSAGGFTFPTNGQDFSVTVPASIDVITGDFFFTCPNPTCSFTLETEPGFLTLSYSYDPTTGLYFASGGSLFADSVAVTPEPATLGFVSIGVGAVAWRKYKQRSRD